MDPPARAKTRASPRSRCANSSHSNGSLALSFKDNLAFPLSLGEGRADPSFQCAQSGFTHRKNVRTHPEVGQEQDTFLHNLGYVRGVIEHQQQIYIAVPPRLIPGQRAKQDDPLRVESLSEPADHLLDDRGRRRPAIRLLRRPELDLAYRDHASIVVTAGRCHAYSVSAMHVASLARRAVDFVFPPRCVVCGRFGAFLCAPCIDTMRPAEDILDDESWWTPGAGWEAASAFWYEGAARRAVLALKFRGLSAGAETMGDLMAGVVDQAVFSCDVVVPVPLHRSRERSRGYNQAQLLAGPVAQRLDVPVSTDLVVRRQATQPQTEMLDADHRRRNVAEAFEAQAAVAGLRVLLVDDVTTTGTTIAACAASLLHAGAANVAALTFAKER